MNIGKFSIRLLAFAAVMAVIIQVLIMQEFFLTSEIWMAFGFFTVLAFLVFLIAIMGVNKAGRNHLIVIMGSLVFRLFAALIFFLIHLKMSGEIDITYAISFMFLYVLFQVFEIYNLVAILRPVSKR